MSRPEKPDPWFALSLNIERGAHATRVQLQGSPVLVSTVVASLFEFGYPDIRYLIQVLMKVRG
ncbi:hypothetical protein GCM10011297_15110 [Bacterioplanes sanyensis]|uniref:hypothetical protein n=1 Tax=Bacterioplanes sanyensis TaxID=1249553 RepID=UPI00167AD808|nr:hypothetical protein [Bacterioplanes sanyensis]GGY43322.1 hypothetical protein GCM10011297_15110 [Bacterioplanes sanyensis]